METWGGIDRGIGDSPSDQVRIVSRPHCAPEILTFLDHALRTLAPVLA
jgi:hypothetical protein